MVATIFILWLQLAWLQEILSRFPFFFFGVLWPEGLSQGPRRDEDAMAVRAGGLGPRQVRQVGKASGFGTPYSPGRRQGRQDRRGPALCEGRGLQGPAPGPRVRPATIATTRAEPGGDGNPSDMDALLPAKWSLRGLNLGILALWFCFGVYAFKFSPNAAVVTDRTLLQAAINLGVDEDGNSINRIFLALFYVLGLLPVIYASLLLPSGKSGNGVPAWPFVSLSMFLGAFGLLPYFALWQPCARRRDVLGSQSKLTRFLESKANAAVVLASLAGLTAMVATASSSDWSGYLSLFGKSRFTHVSSLDFCVLTLMAPFWVYNDAEQRQWKRG